jgi:hypothetical protein
MNGGFFHPDTMYDLPKKMEVAEIYIDMCWTMFPEKPSLERVGEKARVSPSFAEKVMGELSETGHVLDPELVKSSWKKAQGIRSCLTMEMEIFLLALHLEHPERPNIDCIRQLNKFYGKTVSSGFILEWLKTYFHFVVPSARQILSPWISSSRGTLLGSSNSKKDEPASRRYSQQVCRSTVLK